VTGAGTNRAMVIVIVAIVLVILVGGVLLAKKGFTRGTMAETPSEDQSDTSSVGAGDEEGVTADPQAAGRPSDRGNEQKL
jgi:hypothetical protein